MVTSYAGLCCRVALLLVRSCRGQSCTIRAGGVSARRARRVRRARRLDPLRRACHADPESAAKRRRRKCRIVYIYPIWGMIRQHLAEVTLLQGLELGQKTVFASFLRSKDWRHGMQKKGRKNQPRRARRDAEEERKKLVIGECDDDGEYGGRENGGGDGVADLADVCGGLALDIEDLLEELNGGGWRSVGRRGGLNGCGLRE